MPTNVEVKAIVRNMDKLKELAHRLSGKSPQVIVQKDTFYNVPTGRLKLRKLQDEPSQLIYYQRENSEGPKQSNYQIAPVNEPGKLDEVLSLALGIKGMVSKTRLLYLVGQTRIHVDEVDGLGNFMELEVVMDVNQTSEEGQKITEELLEKLEIPADDLLSGAYVDLIKKSEN